MKIMKLKNRYFLLRHGKTTYQNEKKGIMYPSLVKQAKIKLTPASKKKLKKLAEQIKKEKIDLIYSSDILRVCQTAKIMAAELGLKINFDKRLRDTKHGIYEGKTKKEFYRALPNPWKRFVSKPKGGESWNDVRIRTASFIKEIEKKHKNKRILVVSHGDVLWLFEGIAKDMTNQELLDEIFVKKRYIQPEEFRKI